MVLGTGGWFSASSYYKPALHPVLQASSRGESDRAPGPALGVLATSVAALDAQVNQWAEILPGWCILHPSQASGESGRVAQDPPYSL